MERSKYFIVVVISIMSITSVKATYKAFIYQAYISNDMAKWKKVIDKMYLKENKSNEFLLELVNYQYGYIGWCLAVKKEGLAKKYLVLAKNNIEILEQKGYRMSIVNSYKSAFYGFQIGLNKLKAPFVGPKSVECAKKAIALDKNDAFGYIQYGNCEYYMPAIFGGSKSVAIANYTKAMKLMERNTAQIKNDWNYLSLLTIIAEAYTELKQYQKAKLYYQKILKIEPGFLWVKNQLYPELIKKIN